MASSFYFNNYASSQEQLLIENLIVESIRIYGYDVYYLPRRNGAKDDIYGQDPSSYYDSNYFLEMYIKNVEGFEGEGDFISKFNLEIRDRTTFTVARRTFETEIGTSESMTRPLEGDLIYFPLNKKIFQIKFVEHESIFYQLGALQTYDLVCELFEYSNEKLNTGIPEIDALQASYSTALSNFSLLTEEFNFYHITDEDGYKLVDEAYDLEAIDPSSNNDEFQQEGNTFIDFTVIDPFSEGKI
jgi:hypothetical protein